MTSLVRRSAVLRRTRLLTRDLHHPLQELDLVRLRAQELPQPSVGSALRRFACGRSDVRQ